MLLLYSSVNNTGYFHLHTGKICIKELKSINCKLSLLILARWHSHQCSIVWPRIRPFSSIQAKTHRLALLDDSIPPLIVPVGTDRHFYFVDQCFYQINHLIYPAAVFISYPSYNFFIPDQFVQLLPIDLIVIFVCFRMFFYQFFIHLFT